MGLTSKQKSSLMIKFFIILLVIACTGPFFIKDKNGRPFMSLRKIQVKIADSYISLKHFLKLDLVPESDKTTLSDEKYKPYKDKDYTEMYKYRDKKGILHFTDKKPVDIDYEIMYMPLTSKADLIKDKTGKMFNNLFNGKKNNNKANSASGDSKSDALEMLKKVKKHYQNAPNSLNEAKNLKKQVEETYQRRDKSMED